MVAVPNAFGTHPTPVPVGLSVNNCRILDPPAGSLPGPL